MAEAFGQRPPHPGVPRRILLGQLASNGDCLYVTTLARQIKFDNPGCHLTWAVASKCKKILLNNPDIDEFWEIPNATSRENYMGAWWSFEETARQRLAKGDFDTAYFSQILPTNCRNFDGTIRPSVFRAYGAPITVPIRSILRPFDAEVEKAARFAAKHGLSAAGKTILFECACTSGQSFVTPEWALAVAKLVRKRLPDVSIVLSSDVRVSDPDKGIVDGSGLSMRETAALLPYCGIFAGCGSGLTVIASTLEQSPPDLPIMQFLARETSVFASFAEDFKYWNLPNEQFIETCRRSPDSAAEALICLCSRGVAETKRRFHRPAPLSFSSYLALIRDYALTPGRPWDAVQSLRLTVERFGWDGSLREFVNAELIPHLAAQCENNDGGIAFSALMDLYRLLNGGKDRDASKPGLYSISGYEIETLPQPMRISIGSWEEVQRLHGRTRNSITAMNDRLRTGLHHCDFLHQGMSIAESEFTGSWDTVPGHATAWETNSPPLYGLEGNKTAVIAVAAEAAPAAIDLPEVQLPPPSRPPERALWRHLKRAPERVVKRVLRVIGLEELVSQKLRAYKAERRRKKMPAPEIFVAPPVQSEPPKPEVTTPSSSVRTVFVGTADEAKRFEGRCTIDMRLLPGYGKPKYANRFAIRPGEESFLYWLCNGHIDKCDASAVILFGSTRYSTDNLAALQGMLLPKQRIGFPTGEGGISLPKGFIPDGGASNSGISLFIPPASWLRPVYKTPESELPVISVVVPSFNYRKFLAHTLDSVLAQNYPKLELIVLDPGSTDGSRELLEQYRDRIPRMVFEPDSGQSDGIQRGLNMATGDILTWLCADDMLEPDSLHMVAYFSRLYGTDMIAGGCRRINESGETLYTWRNGMPVGIPLRLPAVDLIDISGSFFQGNYFMQPELFFTRRIWEKSGAFLFKSAYYAMDYDLWLRMALAGATIVSVPPLLGCSRVHSQQKTTLHEETCTNPWDYQLGNSLRLYWKIFHTMLTRN